MNKKKFLTILSFLVFAPQALQASTIDIETKVKKTIIKLVSFSTESGYLSISLDSNKDFGGFIINGWGGDYHDMISDKKAVCKLKDKFPNSITFIDQEGGVVRRYKEMEMIGAHRATEMSEIEYKNHVLKFSKILKERCIDVNLAPVLNIARKTPVSYSHPRKIDEKRSYSSDPEIVQNYANQFVEATYEAGLLPTAKHFPGDIMIDEVAFDSPYINMDKGFRWEVNNIETDYDLKENIDMFFFDGPQFLMWSNNIFKKYADKPAFMVNEFKSWIDEEKCNCLLITDSLSELKFKDEVVIEAFNNSDMIMIYGDPKFYVEKIKNLIYENKISIDALDKKIQRVENFKTKNIKSK